VRGIGRASLIGLVGLIAVQYLAGYLFLWRIGLDPHRATPLTTIRYAYYYGDVRPVRARLVFALTAAFVLVAGSGLLMAAPRPRSLHGDARFARRGEISRAGLVGRQGIILGRIGFFRGRLLLLDGQQGVALVAPPRAGKGAGIVIPNALAWPGSLVCIDIKKENWTITAGYRSSAGQACYLFDPLSEEGRTARWNPFSYVSSERNRRINDIQRIASMFYPEVPGADPFWMASARSLFLGIALYIFETPQLPKTIGEVLRQGMASDDEGFGHHWKRLIQGRKSGRYPLSSECMRALSDVIDLAPVTASSIRKTFTSRLDLWLNPMLDAATAASDFDLRELRSQRVSIYVGVNPDDLHRLRPVLSLFFEQAIGLQTRELPEHDPRLTNQLLMLLDEAPALGRIPILAESIAYLPGYNVRVALVCQAPSQLREVYGEMNTQTMLKSLGARIVFAPKDYEDAKAISDDLGMTTVKARSRSQPIWSTSLRGRGGASVSVSEQRRALLLPQEVRELGPDKEIIFCEGLRPILARKIRYYKDPRFRRRLLSPPASTVATTSSRIALESPVEPQPGAPAAPPLQSAGAIAPVEPGPGYTVREATFEDLGRDLALSDFDADFSGIEIPKGREISDSEITRVADEFLASLRGK